VALHGQNWAAHHLLAASQTDDVWTLVLAGSAGDRLWPQRETKGQPAGSAIGSTLATLMHISSSIKAICPLNTTLVSCAPFQVIRIARGLPELPEHNIVTEPLPRGTGPVIALVAAMLVDAVPSRIVVSLPSDNTLVIDERFISALIQGTKVARLDWITEIVFSADGNDLAPHYVLSKRQSIGDKESKNAHPVERYIRTDEINRFPMPPPGRLLFRCSGVHIWSPSYVLTELRRIRTDLAVLADRLVEGIGDKDYERVAFILWSSQPVTSMEYDIFRNMSRRAVISVD
jgi:mannose-1-phosphate guanylyltransferase